MTPEGFNYVLIFHVPKRDRGLITLNDRQLFTIGTKGD
jgi:hypothetical protein